MLSIGIGLRRRFDQKNESVVRVFAHLHKVPCFYIPCSYFQQKDNHFFPTNHGVVWAVCTNTYRECHAWDAGNIVD